MEEKRKSAIPKNPADTKWCVKQWNEWAAFRNQNKTEKIPIAITAIPTNQFGYWLELFVLEVRKKDGSKYSSTSLHHLVAGLMCYLREADVDIDIFQDKEFANFRKTFGEMKRIRSTGDGTS